MLDTTATLRAAVEAIVPGPPHDPAPGALEAGADRFAAEVLERLGAERAAGVPMALDLFAQAGEGARFAELSPKARRRVLRSMQANENPDARAVVRLLFSLTLAAVYGADSVGYPGPSTGYELRRRA